MVFLSVHDALRWAYDMEGVEVVAMSSAFRNRGSSARAWGAFTTWDRHAQAALVRGQAEHLGDPLAAYAVAYYGHVGEARLEAAQALVAWVAPEHLGTDLQPAYELMVSQYLLAANQRRSGGIGRIRHELGCRKTSALNERKRIFDLLDGLRTRLLIGLSGPLADGGLVSLSAGQETVQQAAQL